MVLSCATLPDENDITDTLGDFKMRFDNAEIHSITSYDCKKSIPIMTKDGYCAVPHTMYSNHDELVECANHCDKNKTLLRYFDLGEIVKFAFYINMNELVESRMKMDNYFERIDDITMNSLKLYYLELLKHISKEKWSGIYEHMKMKQRKPFSSPENNKNTGILITTEDANTLTDGPTIFLTEDALKIGKFYTQQSAIPVSVYQEIMKKISMNNKLSSEIADIENALSLSYCKLLVKLETVYEDLYP